MAARRLLYVIAYDIADDRRRRRIASLLEERAARVQESLFEQRLSNREAAQLFAALKALCHTDDSLRLYPVPDAALPRARTHGGPQIAGGGRYWIV
ncbi:MAG: CRISPR-associated endonuclease Cas2 [Sphingopyxis sp.]